MSAPTPTLPTAVDIATIPTAALQMDLESISVPTRSPLARFTNWARTFECRPQRVFHPTTEVQCRQIIELARREGATVHPVGVGHSPSDLACTNGWLVRMEGLSGVVNVSTPGVCVVTSCLECIEWRRCARCADGGWRLCADVRCPLRLESAVAADEQDVYTSCISSGDRNGHRFKTTCGQSEPHMAPVHSVCVYTTQQQSPTDHSPSIAPITIPDQTNFARSTT